MKNDTRCAWARQHPLLRQYHDEEWGVPVRDSRALWEKLMLDAFQCGLSWLTVLKKREALREAFAGFDPEIVAKYGEEDVVRLLENPGIIRSRGKIQATIDGARSYLAMRDGGEDFAAFVWTMAGDETMRNDSPEIPTQTPLSKSISVALKKRGFKYVGPVVVYAWMQAVGMVNDHEPECFRR